jgi:hypothetical protein
MDHAHDPMEGLIASAARGPGPAAARLGRALAGHSWPGGADRMEPIAAEWLRRWGPRRSPAGAVLSRCACSTGPCPVCN